MEEKNSIVEISANKLVAEMEAATAKFTSNNQLQRVQKILAEEIGKMLTRFCYQNEEFALAVQRCEKTLIDIVEDITKATSNKAALSDVEAYAAAVKHYLPAAQVVVSFRINLPDELDEDLIELEEGARDSGTSAMILDLFGTDE